MYQYLFSPEIAYHNGEIFDSVADLDKYFRRFYADTILHLVIDYDKLDDKNGLNLKGIGTTYRSKFKKGDVIVDKDANRFKVLGYDFSTQNFKFHVGVQSLESGTTFYTSQHSYMLWSEDTNKPIIDDNICGWDNSKCEIVESYTGCGYSKQDIFYYCRTHDREVPKKDKSKIGGWCREYF